MLRRTSSELTVRVLKQCCYASRMTVEIQYVVCISPIFTYTLSRLKLVTLVRLTLVDV